MNKPKKIIIASTLAAVLAVSALMAVSSLSPAFAEPVEPHAPAGTVKNKPNKPAPNREEAPKRGSVGGSEGKGENCSTGERPGERPPAPPAPATNSNNPEQTDNSVVLSNGYITDPEDHGRPVVLIAAALGVPTEVFREAFRGVTPSGLDSEPSAELAQRNKAALLKVLAPYGITNERLDEVSNYYRYNGRNSDTWRKTPASATAIITDGVVTGVTITNPGAGYSSTPTVTIKGPNGTVTATATVTYTQDFKTNGSITAITINND